MYYIISLTHTMRSHKYITLWRPDNAGYCFSKELAGLYETPEPGYHDSDTNMPIDALEAEKIFMEVTYDGKPKRMIPNEKFFWDKLNVRMTKDGLARTNKLINQN